VAGSTEVVAGRYHVLFVALSTSRCGPQFRRELPLEPSRNALSNREHEVSRRSRWEPRGRRSQRISTSHTTRFAAMCATR
jgi:hypothetical protein